MGDFYDMDNPPVLTGDQVMLIDLLRKVRSKGDAYSFFSKPVDIELDDCPDYWSVIDKGDAMDLKTLEGKIYDGSCTSIDDFTYDVTQIVQNALVYNEDPEHVVHQEALVLKEVLQEQVDLCRARADRANKRRLNYSENDAQFWNKMGEKLDESNVGVTGSTRTRNSNIAKFTGRNDKDDKDKFKSMSSYKVRVARAFSCMCRIILIQIYLIKMSGPFLCLAGRTHKQV